MKKQRIKELWQICFADTEEFISLFFNEVYQEENAVVIEKDGKIVSALHLLPYTLNFYGEEVPIAYIYGVCTHPDERGKGLMSQLMQLAKEELKRRKTPAAALIPAEQWLFDVYRKYGYTEAFYYNSYSYVPTGQVRTNNIHFFVADITTPGLFEFFNKKLKERNACMLHSESDFLVIRKDFINSNGNLLVAADSQNKIIGMAFSVPVIDEGVVVIKELLYESDNIKEELLVESMRLYQLPKAVFTAPPEGARSAVPHGMITIIDENYFNDIRSDATAILSSEKLAYMSLMLD